MSASSPQPPRPRKPWPPAPRHGGPLPTGAPQGATPLPAPLLLSGARLADGRTVDVRLADGRIAAVTTADGPRPGTSRPDTLDLSGYLLLPAPAEPHAHTTDALTANGPRPVHEVRRRTTEAALLHLAHGATALRSHVPVGGAHGLRSLEAVLLAGRALRGLTEVSAVAVPPLLTGRAGANGRAALRDAVAMGATTLGGHPARDPDPTGHARLVLDLATAHGLPVDLHTDGDDPAWLARVADLATGAPFPVTLGPCAGLAHLPAATAARAAERLAAANVTVVCLPQGNCGTLGRTETPPTLMAPVRLLQAAGVRVAAGSGSLRDTTNPVGRADPLEAAYRLVCHGESPPSAYEAISATPRAALGLPPVRIEPGSPADLLAVRGERLTDILSSAASRIVVHAGRVVARTRTVREYGALAARTVRGVPHQGQG
ncbi:amidohydrolase family protein [Streptomyces sp. NPDC003077]|uniref:amidohydrolase family protein n=1 Tax=Streptomyces sp. NPDC003077 TaxID=3154443 RepID=UPI0033A3CC15